MIIYILLKYVKFQHSNTIKYSTCVYHVLTEMTQGLNSLNYYHIQQSVRPFRRFLSSSQLRYSIKFLAIYNLESDSYLVTREFESLDLQHPIISIFGSRLLKIYFLDIFSLVELIYQEPYSYSGWRMFLV